MANSTTNMPRGLSWGILIAPFAAVGRFLVLLAEANPKMRELDRLSLKSDEQLAARGLTREGEIRRIMGVAGFL